MPNSAAVPDDAARDRRMGHIPGTGTHTGIAPVIATRESNNDIQALFSTEHAGRTAQ
jgi:hypothetical protein